MCVCVCVCVCARARVFVCVCVCVCLITRPQKQNMQEGNFKEKFKRFDFGVFLLLDRYDLGEEKLQNLVKDSSFRNNVHIGEGKVV